MNDAERKARQEIAQLTFKHKKFNEDAIYTFGENKGYPAALAVMKQCLAENAEREKQKLQLLNLGSMFRQKARGFKREQIEEQRKVEWNTHVKSVLAEHAVKGGITIDKLVERLEDHHQKKRCTDARYLTGLKFLRSLQLQQKVATQDR